MYTFYIPFLAYEDVFDVLEAQAQARARARAAVALAAGAEAGAGAQALALAGALARAGADADADAAAAAEVRKRFLQHGIEVVDLILERVLTSTAGWPIYAATITLCATPSSAGSAGSAGSTGSTHLAHLAHLAAAKRECYFYFDEVRKPNRGWLLLNRGTSKPGYY